VRRETQVIWGLLSHLVDREQQRSRHYRADLEAIYKQLTSRYPKASREQLENIFRRDHGNLLGTNPTFIFLESADDDHVGNIIPVLSIKFAFSDEEQELRLRLCFFILDKSGGGSAVRGIAFRLETPEGPGAHDFYHAQIITAFEKGHPIDQCPQWLPVRQPSFALDANNPVRLLVCALVSIYGCPHYKKILTGATIPHRSDYATDIQFVCK
jgi:hypothetical protein